MYHFYDFHFVSPKGKPVSEFTSIYLIWKILKESDTVPTFLCGFKILHTAPLIFYYYIMSLCLVLFRLRYGQNDWEPIETISKYSFIKFISNQFCFPTFIFIRSVSLTGQKASSVTFVMPCRWRTWWPTVSLNPCCIWRIRSVRNTSDSWTLTAERTTPVSARPAQTSCTSHMTSSPPTTSGRRKWWVRGSDAEWTRQVGFIRVQPHKDRPWT